MGKESSSPVAEIAKTKLVSGLLQVYNAKFQYQHFHG